MARGRVLYVVLALALLGDALSLPAVIRLPRSALDTRQESHSSPGQGFEANNELDSKTELARGGRFRRSAPGISGVEANDLDSASSDNRVAKDDGSPFTSDNSNGESKVQTTTMKPEFATPVDDDSDEDDEFEPMNTAPTAGGGSNIFSLLRLANAIFPSSSGGANTFILNLLRRYFNNQFNLNNPIYPNGLPFNPATLLLRRQDIDVSENRVDTNEISGLKPPLLQRQETQEDNDDDDDDESEESDENNAAESVEEGNGNGGYGNGNENASKQKSGSEEDGKASGDDENDSDYDEPEGDGQGGGILGILAGLSGGDGESDLGSLLAAVGGIVANLSGDGFDLNALIATGLGLFVGLLSGGEENPGAVIASYLLTSLDTITGGGAKNNGAFFGKLVSKLIRGSSAGGDPDVSLEEGQEPPKDSVGFFKSLLMALLGGLTNGSSKSSSCSGSCGWEEEPAPE